MNLNQLAKEICFHEGKKKQVDIAQVKEVLRVLIDILSTDFKFTKLNGQDKLIEFVQVVTKEAGLIVVPISLIYKQPEKKSKGKKK
jgi:hypothetical protein